MGSSVMLGVVGCCRGFTLDWMADEPSSDDAIEREVTINDQTRKILTYPNDKKRMDQWGWVRCEKLDYETSYCTIHPRRPLSCDFEILRFTKHKTFNHLTNRLFGRGWSFIQIHGGQRKALCELFPATEEARVETIRKLERLQKWTDYFRLQTLLPRVIQWIEGIPLNETKLAVFEPEADPNILSYSKTEKDDDID